jgi:hypothetical protein
MSNEEGFETPFSAAAACCDEVESFIGNDNKERERFFVVSFRRMLVDTPKSRRAYCKAKQWSRLAKKYRRSSLTVSNRYFRKSNIAFREYKTSRRVSLIRRLHMIDVVFFSDAWRQLHEDAATYRLRSFVTGPAWNRETFTGMVMTGAIYEAMLDGRVRVDECSLCYAYEPSDAARAPE